MFMVPGTGIEPAHPYGYKVLNLACLPVSPPRPVTLVYKVYHLCLMPGRVYT